MRKGRSGALRALVIGLIAGAGSLSPTAPPSLRVAPRVLGGLQVLRGGGRPCKKRLAWQSNSAPRGDGIRLALEILNVTLEDMERGRQMGLCGDELPARECMICAGFNVREFSKVLSVVTVDSECSRVLNFENFRAGPVRRHLARDHAGIICMYVCLYLYPYLCLYLYLFLCLYLHLYLTHSQIGLGAVHAEDLRQTPSNGSHPPAYTSHPDALALASSSRGGAPAQAAEGPGADSSERGVGVGVAVGVEGGGTGVSSSRGESRQHVSRDLRPGCRVRVRAEDRAYNHLWAVFLCRPCAAGMGWEGHQAFYTTSKRCAFCVRRASYGADGGQVSVAIVLLPCC
jgi:hypothetical protein